MRWTRGLYVTAAAMATFALTPTVVGWAAPTKSRTTTFHNKVVNKVPSAQIAKYWTPQRLAAAKPMDAPPAASTVPAGTKALAGQPKTGTPHLVPASAPKSNGTFRATSEGSTLGRLYASAPGGTGSCSANVVTSNNHDVIATARHCVMDISTGTVYDNFWFIPAYSQGNAPYGGWSWRSVYWRPDLQYGGDNAFIVLNQGGNWGQHIQDTVGGSGIGFNLDTHNYARASGIPADTDAPTGCEGWPYDGQEEGVQIPNCEGMHAGASGGPFIAYQPDGSAFQTATYRSFWGPDSYFAYFRDATWNCYNVAQNS